MFCHEVRFANVYVALVFLVVVMSDKLEEGDHDSAISVQFTRVVGVADVGEMVWVALSEVVKLRFEVPAPALATRPVLGV